MNKNVAIIMSILMVTLSLASVLSVSAILAPTIAVNNSFISLGGNVVAIVSNMKPYIPAYVMYQKLGVTGYQSATSDHTTTDSTGGMQVSFTIGPPNTAAVYDVWAIDGSTSACFERACAATNIIQVVVQGGHPVISITQTLIRPAADQATPSYVTITGSGFVPGGQAAFTDLNCWGTCTGYQYTPVDTNGNIGPFQYPIGLGYASIIRTGSSIGIIAVDNSVKPFGIVTSNIVTVTVQACGEPQWGTAGTLAISSITWTPGDTITYSGTGFTPSTVIAIGYFTGSYPPTGWGFVGGTSATTDGTGAFSLTAVFTGHEGFPLTMNVIAIDQGNCKASNVVTVTDPPKTVSNPGPVNPSVTPSVPVPEFPMTQSLVAVLMIGATLLVLKRKHTTA